MLIARKSEPSVAPCEWPQKRIFATSNVTDVPPSSTVPDFAKPANDDKYYKPLKRF